jgi:GntR family transcriptional regulator
VINRYLEISESISREIDLNVFAEGGKLPAERWLSERFGASRETIRKALRHLIDSGKIYSIQGSGYYVRRISLPMKSTINRYSSITQLIRDANMIEGDLEVQIFKRRPNDTEVQCLEMDKHDWVYVIDRIRAANGEPVVYSQNILPESIVGTDFPSTFEPGSLTACLKEKYGISIAEALTEIRAVTDEDTLPYRLRQNNSPLLKFIQVHYDAKMVPIFFSNDYMRNDLIFSFLRKRI